MSSVLVFITVVYDDVIDHMAKPTPLSKRLATTDFCEVASFLAVKAGLAVGWALSSASWVGWGTASWKCEYCGTTFPVLWFMKCCHCMILCCNCVNLHTVSWQLSVFDIC